MRLTVEVSPGVIELNWMWLPTWIGINHGLKKQLEQKVGTLFKGRELSDATLDELDDAIIEELQKSFPEILFSDYLRAIRHVQQQGG